jgi:arylsulfatase A-like enzyme
MHGFLNVLGAGVLAAEHRWSETQTLEMLADENASSFVFGEEAFRWGDWKILATLDKPPERGVAITPESEADFKAAELKEFQLYNLREDVGEKHDLAQEQPAKLSEMRTLLAAKYHEVRDEAPTWPAWQPPAAPGKKKK